MTGDRSKSNKPAPVPFQRMRLWGPSLVTLAVLLPFFAYYLREVKIAQGYLNDRAFRILDVISRQFGSEINGVGNTMDAASMLPEQLDLRRRNGVLSPRARWLASTTAPFNEIAQVEIKAYLDAYILDGISTPKVEDFSKDTKLKDDPEVMPQISICCRSTNSAALLRLFSTRVVNVPDHKQLQITIDTKLDPNRMIERALGAGQGTLFETVFVATRTGRVLAEMNSSKLNVRDVEAILANRKVRAIIEGTQKPEKEEAAADNADQPKLPREVWGSDQRFDVQVSGTGYVLFVAPAPFILSDEAGKELPIAVYGLTNKDAIDAQARRLPSLVVPVIFILLIAGIAFLWPALKLYTMSERDRVSKPAVFAMLGAAGVACVLLGAMYLSYGFYLDMSQRNDRQVVQLSNQIRRHFVRDIGDAVKASNSVLGTLNLGSQWPEDAYHLLTVSCPKVLAQYPFLVHVTLLGQKPKGEGALPKADSNEPVDQRQVIKYSATSIPTPLILLPATKFGFIAGLVEGRYATLGDNQFVLQSFVSPNTGEFLPTLAYNPPNRAFAGYRFMATTQLPSLVHAILPQGFSFAVVDTDGQVLFHSDPSRNLHENFFGETDDADELKSALRRREEKHLSIRYGGRQARAYVRPLGCQGPETEPCVHDLGFGLIVFRRMDDQKELLSSVGANFLAYLLGLPVLVGALILTVLGMKRSVWPTASITWARRRMWPRREEKPFYILKALWGLICFWTALLLSILFREAAEVYGSLPLVLPAVLVLVLIICIIGIVLLRRKAGPVTKLAGGSWVKRCENRVPLSAAYPAQIFATALAVGGTVSLIVFQLAVSSAELQVTSNRNRALATAILDRKIRYREDFNKYFENPKEAETQWNQFCQARIKDGYDLYEGLAAQQGSLTTLASMSSFFGRFGFLGGARPLTDLPNPCGTQPAGSTNLHAEFVQESIWNALPAPSATNLGLFYVPGLVLMIAIFLWIHRIIRRLFILDFREPSPTPLLEEKDCLKHMQEAVSGHAGRPLDRILIFSHPRSGTGVALERILKQLKEGSPDLADFQIIDFGRCGGEPHTNYKIAILDNFEVRLTETEERTKRLQLLEDLVYAHKPSVYVFTSVDPLLLIESLVHGGAHSDELDSELSRWTRLLGNFERFVFQDRSLQGAVEKTLESIRQQCLNCRLADGSTREYCDTFELELKPTLFLRGCSQKIKVNELDFTSGRHFEETLVRQVSNLADGYYRVIWLNCTNDERLALYQLAKDDWLNPLNKVAIAHLLKKQLITREETYRDKDGSQRTRDVAYRLMNVSFKRFVLEAVTAREVAMWERQQNLSLWPALRMALVLAVFLVVLFVSYFWRDIFDVYLSYFVALAGGIAALLRLVAQFFVRDGGRLAIFGDKGSKGGEQPA